MTNEIVFHEMYNINFITLENIKFVLIYSFIYVVHEKDFTSLNQNKSQNPYINIFNLANVSPEYFRCLIKP